MKWILRVLLIFLTSGIFAQKVQAQTYEVIFLGFYEDSLTFDTTLNWYCSVIDHRERANNHRQKILEIDPQSDLIQTFVEKDSVYQLSYANDSVYFQFIIGTSDSLYQREFTPARDYRNIYYVPLGTSYAVIEPPVIRSYSPYINLYVTGTYTLNNVWGELEYYSLKVACDFDSWAYYKYTEINGERFEERNSFVQDLTPMMLNHMMMESFKHEFSNIYFGYVDGDGLKDVIVVYGKKHFLFLTYKSDFKNHHIYHLEKVWSDPRWSPEF